jgi:copper transport protein
MPSDKPGLGATSDVSMMIVRDMRPVRRALTVGALVAGAMIAPHGLLTAHAMLLSSDPKAGSVLTKSPERVRLVFSEAIDASVSGIRLVLPRGAPIELAVSADPRDVSALVAPLAPLAAASYRIAWRTVSADGHAVNGSFGFRVRGDTATGPVIEAMPPPIPLPDTLASFAPTRFPVSAALVRGLALGCLMALAGILFFSRRATVHSARAFRVSGSFAAAAVVLLAAHLVAWMSSAAADHGFDLSWGRSMLGTTPGHMELARLGAAILALWALVLARRQLLALLFAGIALVVSGAIGHPAAMHSLWTIPAKTIHLCAGAAWLGGLLWLLLADRADAEKFVGEARRVSSVALIAVLLVVFSGVIQTWFFVVTPADLFRTTYGIVILLKIAGVLILIAFGAHHRYRHLPGLANAAATRLRDSVRYEIGVFVLVTLLGGLLAYIPPRGSKLPATNATVSSRRIP